MTSLRTRRSSARAPRSALPAAVLVALCTTACGDDPPSTPRPGGDPWIAAALPQDLGAAGLLAIDAAGSRVVAVGVTGPGAIRARAGASVGSAPSGPRSPRIPSPASSSAPQQYEPVLLESVDGEFRRVDTGFLPDGAILLDVALNPAGETVVVGGRDAGGGLVPTVVDSRGGWHGHSPAGIDGGLQAVTFNDGRFLAGGAAEGGLLLESAERDSWSRVTAPFTSPQEKGITDLESEGMRTLALGWDDADLSDFVLERSDDGTWIEHPGPGASDVELRAVAALETGSYLAGGRRDDGSDPGAAPRGALFGRQADGSWFAIVLPDAGAMQAINDIRVVGTDVFLACGETSGSLWRWNGETWHAEMTGVPGAFLSLASDGDGRTYAAGRTGSEAASEPLILIRDP